MKINIIFQMLLFCACNTQTKKQAKQIDSPTAKPQNVNYALKKYTGTYLWQEDPQGYNQTLIVEESKEGKFLVHFTASQIKGKPGCSFEGVGKLNQDTLKVPVNWRDKTVFMTLFLKEDTMHVFKDNFEDRFVLSYYCSGGSSLAGDYYRK